MVGIFLVGIGTALSEISSSLGKWEISHKREGIYTFGFVNTFWMLVVLVGLVIMRGNFVFVAASLPLFGILFVLECLQVIATLHAIAVAERSSFGLIMTMTIPLLLLVDFVLGYEMSVRAFAGVGSIILGLVILFLNHGIERKGLGFVLFSALNSVVTLSLYKHLITYYNSVEGQQIVMNSLLLIFLFCMALWRDKINPIEAIHQRLFLTHSITHGIGAVIMSVAYSYAPASIITAARRGVSALFGIVSGRAFFAEKHITVKMLALVFALIGLILLAQG